MIGSINEGRAYLLGSWAVCAQDAIVDKRWSKVEGGGKLSVILPSLEAKELLRKASMSSKKGPAESWTRDPPHGNNPKRESWTTRLPDRRDNISHHTSCPVDPRRPHSFLLFDWKIDLSSDSWRMKCRSMQMSREIYPVGYNPPRTSHSLCRLKETSKMRQNEVKRDNRDIRTHNIRVKTSTVLNKSYVWLYSDGTSSWRYQICISES